MKKFLIIIGIICLGVSNVLAQTVQVSGIVTDAGIGQSLPGVSVVVKGTTNGTVTDVDGKYSLSVPPNATLVFSFVGMATQEIAVGNRQTIDVVLTEGVMEIDEIVVVGYGVAKKAAFTGAATTLKSQDIINKTDPNAIKSLDGTIPGLQMTVSSGQPGAPADIFLRGRNSINSGTQPLYVVDGIVMTSDALGMRIDEGQSVSPLVSINPQDILDITVLKDATATSIYGARAANGVIVITTKKGETGKIKINIDARIGMEMMPSYPKSYHLLNHDDYIELQTEGIINKPEWFGTFPSKADATQFLFDGLYEGDYGIPVDPATDVDWMDEVTRTGLVQDYNISLQGGGKDKNTPTYYISLGMFDNKALIKGKDLTRYSFRLNLDHQVNQLVKYGVNSTLSYTETNLGAGGGYFVDPITQAKMQSPLIPVYDDNGDWNFNTLSGYNPVAEWSEYGDVSNAKQYRALIAPYLTLNFTDNFFFTSRAGVDFLNLNEFGVWSFLQPQGAEMRGMGENGTDTQTILSITNTLNYIKTFNDVHNINVMLGQEIQKTYLRQTYLAGSNYAVDYLNPVDLTSVPTSASTSSYTQALASFFANVQYDYKSKYYLSGSVRGDGSSRFGANNRWAVFYSFGARYRISEESSMEGTRDWLNNLSIRSSYGTSGNQYVGKQTVNTRWYPSRGLFGFGYNYNGLPGSANQQFANPDLRWEQTAKFNVGVDITVFDRLSLEFDFYNHRTHDMVFNVPLTRATGLQSILKNIGELQNQGVEFTINALAVKTQDFSWDMTWVGSHNKNKILKLSTDLPIEGTFQITEVGREYNSFKMKEYAGVDPQTGQPLWYAGTEGSETTTSYNAAGKRYVGAPTPKFLGSFTNRLAYKGIDFSFQLNYSIGGKIYGNNLRYDEHVGSSGLQNTTQYVYDNRWKQPGDIATVPKYAYGGFAGYNSASSVFLMDGDYLKIKNLTLGYTLPEKLTKPFGVSSFRVYVTADNLYTFCASNYRGFDPAGIGSDGVQWWNYPLPRNVMFGLNVGF